MEDKNKTTETGKQKANKGQPQKQFSFDEIIQMSKTICDLYASGEYTIASCCEAVGICDRTFRYWAVKYSEVAEFYKAAKDLQDRIFFDMLLPNATRSSLLRLIEGEKYTQVKRETGEGPSGPIDKMTETEMVVLPNASAVIFASKGCWPNVFIDQHRIDHTSKGDKMGGGLHDLPIEKQIAILKILDGDDATTENNG